MTSKKQIPMRVGDRVKIDTGNCDGSIPSVEFYGTVQSLGNTTALVLTDDGELHEIHRSRLTTDLSKDWNDRWRK